MERQENLIKSGHIFEITQDPFAILILTPLMRRGHDLLQYAKDCVFIDSTSCCDSESHSITFVMTPCSIGAMPLGMIITKGQTSAEYVAGFSMLKDVPGSFGGQGHPKLFITDDSMAERNALRIVWPASRRLLCRFHVSQAVWRWLWGCIHGIDASHRQLLYYSFQKILSAETTEQAEEAYQHAVHLDTARPYPKWINYIKGYWSRREDWCLAYRDASTHGHQTNNFCEISVRLFKDIVLRRTVTFNLIVLVDFISLEMESYYINRIREVLNRRSSKPILDFNKLIIKFEKKQNDIFKISEHNFAVCSRSYDYTEVDRDHSYAVSSRSNNIYKIDTISGFCTCREGQLGKLCKHQAAVFQEYERNMPNAPPMTVEALEILARLAFGDQAQPIQYYMPIQQLKEVGEAKSGKQEESTECIIAEESTEGIIEEESTECIIEEESTECIIEEERMGSMIEEESTECIIEEERMGSTIVESSADEEFFKIFQRMNEIQKKSFYFVLDNLDSPSVRNRYRISKFVRKFRRGVIPVQPTSISRRQAGVTRTKKRLLKRQRR
jgi:hypothetical protein